VPESHRNGVFLALFILQQSVAATTMERQRLVVSLLLNMD
jgi:hypothetical protein